MSHAAQTAVVLQPMYFPWVGYLEQIQHADVFVHYDDVQFRKNSVYNRVRVKTAQGPVWMTAPVKRAGRARIDTAEVLDSGWRQRHLRLLEQSLARAPHRDDALELATSVLDLPTASLAELCIASIRALATYFGLEARFERSSRLEFSPMGNAAPATARLIGLCESLGATRYLTGHGARDYLDHEAFEREGVEVHYMDYARRPYPQRHGAFDPHVSALDLVAHRGREGRDVMVSTTRPWRTLAPLHP